MANFFDKVLVEINKGVSSVSDGSKNLMEKAKINTAISESEEQKLKLAQSLGIKVYNMYMSGGVSFPAELNEYCDAITNKISEIKTYQKRLAELNAKPEQNQFYAPNQTEAQPQPQESAACACGYVNAPNSKFCAKCGNKLM